jgi:hypothetical protein
MKAIFIPNDIYTTGKLEKLNDELKNCSTILYNQKIEKFGESLGILLIVGNHTRKDKLKKLKKISNEGTNNNTI